MVRASKRLGFSINLEAFDRTLYLANRPFGLNAEEFIGAWIILIAGVLVLTGSTLVLGANALQLNFLIIAATILIPFIKIRTAAEEGREKLGLEIIDLVQQMELGVSAGLSVSRVLEWATEGTGKLAGILRVLVKESRLGGERVYPIFSRLADDWGVVQAREIAMTIKQAEIQGLPIGGILLDLAKDLRYQREHGLDTQVAKIKPSVTAILTISCMIGAICLMVGPIGAEFIQNFGTYFNN